MSSPHGLQSPDFLGTMCRADDQLLEEAWMIPSSIIWSNSDLATVRRSGGRRRVRHYTGGPEVTMWCTTLCLIGVSGNKRVISG